MLSSHVTGDVRRSESAGSPAQSAIFGLSKSGKSAEKCRWWAMPINKAASAKGESGFTLIDLLFTASLICTLCTMALPSLMRARGVAQSASALGTRSRRQQLAAQFRGDVRVRLLLAGLPDARRRAARQPDRVPAARAVERRVVPEAGLQLHHDRHGAGGRAADLQRQAGGQRRARATRLIADPLDPVGNPHFYGSNADGTIYQHTATLAGSMPESGPPSARRSPVK